LPSLRLALSKLFIILMIRINDGLPQTGSPFRISWPSLTLTSTTTPDMGAPTEPGSAVAFSRETVSTAEFLSSTDTART
jgi:hypothetical protein